MRSSLLADENIPWPLVKCIRDKRLDVLWIPETGYRGISDIEVIELANKEDRVVLTRDSEYLKLSLRRRATRGIIYVGEPIRRENVEKLTINVLNALEVMKGKRLLAILTSNVVELYPLTPQ